ncbi:MAG: hypothetical protein QOJ82_1064 [Solirubrobacteraceae bacterium]|jgi:hypothetical protein|nr:hypothetical protein [Solirubrobacteraceae bacterium]
MRRPVPVALLLIALALVAAGCGGDTKASNAYVDAVNKAQNTFATSFDKLSSRITATSTPAQDQQTLEGFRQAVDRAVGDLRAIDVPEKVKPLHRRLVTEISAYGREIDRAKTAFDSSDPQAIVRAQTRLVTAVTRVSSQINATIDQINRKLRQ